MKFLQRAVLNLGLGISELPWDDGDIGDEAAAAVAFVSSMIASADETFLSCTVLVAAGYSTWLISKELCDSIFLSCCFELFLFLLV